MTSYSSRLEDLIDQLGGCGRLQIILCISVHCTGFITFWSVLGMSFIGYDPGFNCHALKIKHSALSSLNISDLSISRLCTIENIATCTTYTFPKRLNTVVSEWDLVCDRRWIVSLITSIQMVGVVIGSIISGQIADSIGRKPTAIAGVSIMLLFNFAGYFAQSWKVYTLIRFFVGNGFGLTYTVQFTYMIEFIPSSWRSLAVCFPSAPFVCMLYALATWGLHDWKQIHLLNALVGLLSLINLCLVPESFRWLVSKQKFKRAEKSINIIANVNRVQKPDLKKIFNFEMAGTNTSTKRSALLTVALLWKAKDLRTITLSLSIVWFAVCTSWYSMALGMESISIDIFLTIFLTNLVDLPALSATGPLVNRFGRKPFCLVSIGISSILSCLSGILQHFDKVSPSSASLTMAALLLSLLAKMTISAAFAAKIIYTTELYPTEVRTTGYGIQATVGRLGAIVAPLLIHLDGVFPGSMYFICGMLMFLSTGCVLFLKETKGVVLQDTVT